jgi:hypothetical protein
MNCGEKQVTNSVQNYTFENAEPTPSSRVATILIRMPLLMVTVIFTLISFRYLTALRKTAAAVGIAFTSPDGITVARVGFAAFPLVFAVLALACLVSERRVLIGLYMVLTLATIVFVVRTFGIIVDHSGSPNARLLVPEALLVGISLLGIRLARAKRRQHNSE